ncbi:MAG: ATP-dependent DNA helicase RecG, partial [Armatimonadetes bacterium]|nr:ATP-dependent DNA helicase RecG [Armatimonadota bacterium]
TAGDLVLHFPHRYEDRSQLRPIVELRDGEKVTVVGQLAGSEAVRTKNNKFLFKAYLQDDTGILELVFFNQWYLKKVFSRLNGRWLSVYGTVEVSPWGIVMKGPDWEELDEQDPARQARIMPVYPLTEGLYQKTVRRVVLNALALCLDHVPELLPEAVRARHRLVDIRTALKNIHEPEDAGKLDLARRRLVFEEFFWLQLALAVRKRTLQEEKPGIAFPLGEDFDGRFAAALPFSLTGAQRRVIAEIRADMAGARPMNRLLQGDVGSGKTVVATAAIMTAIEAGYQAALMAPTEILAEQHYLNLSELLHSRGVEVHLLIGSVRQKGKQEIRDRLADGRCQLVVGTHALIQESVSFRRLGLVIIDEQHRFGVLQRLELVQKGLNPDVLVMSATPIPRTLALTVYGDLDVSIIDELPPGRKPVRTFWKQEKERAGVYKGIERFLDQGRQAYVVCPLVEGNERLSIKAATELYERIQGEVFPQRSVGLIHGQLGAWEKQDVMERFRNGEIELLVATTVIEVGVDVPNATVMMVEDADHFGLATLHQLRGRIRRSEHESYCVLLCDPSTEESKRRLEILVHCDDGFRIADEDLRLRGPGEFTGTRQSGLLNLRIADVIGDAKLLDLARREAFTLITDDPELSRPEHAPLQAELHRKYHALAWASVS